MLTKNSNSDYIHCKAKVKKFSDFLKKSESAELPGEVLRRPG